MKTFNATELNKSAAKVFREADINGSVKINHDRYPDKVFVMEARERGLMDDGKLVDGQLRPMVIPLVSISKEEAIEKWPPKP